MAMLTARGRATLAAGGRLAMGLEIDPNRAGPSRSRAPRALRLVERGYRRVEGHSAHVLVDAERVLEGRDDALLAVHLLAEPAGRADGHRGVVVADVHPVGVDELLGVAELATHADRLDGVGDVVAASIAPDRPGDAEVRRTVG